MSSLNDNSIQYKREIRNNFRTLDPDKNGIIETDKLNDFINSINSKKQIPFYIIQSNHSQLKRK